MRGKYDGPKINDYDKFCESFYTMMTFRNLLKGISPAKPIELTHFYRVLENHVSMICINIYNIPLSKAVIILNTHSVTISNLVL